MLKSYLVIEYVEEYCQLNWSDSRDNLCINLTRGWAINDILPNNFLSHLGFWP